MDHRFDEVMEFRNSLNPETDRGCALMAAAFLDSELELLLRSFVVDNEKAQDEIFSQSKPIGTFSSRIDLAFLLGLISADTRKDLHLIRKIRNDFGHVHRPISFEDQAMSNRCRELKHHFRGNNEPPRKIFISSAVGALALLHTAMHKRARIVERPNPDLNAAKERQTKIMSAVMAALEEAPPKNGKDT